MSYFRQLLNREGIDFLVNPVPGDWLVLSFPSYCFLRIYLVVSNEGIELSNNYFGQLPGFLAVGVYVRNFLKYGIHFLWIVKPEYDI